MPQSDHPRLPTFCRHDVFVFSVVFLVGSYIAFIIMVGVFIYQKVTGKELHLRDVIKLFKKNKSSSRTSSKRSDRSSRSSTGRRGDVEYSRANSRSSSRSNSNRSHRSRSKSRSRDHMEP